MTAAAHRRPPVRVGVPAGRCDLPDTGGQVDFLRAHRLAVDVARNSLIDTLNGDTFSLMEQPSGHTAIVMLPANVLRGRAVPASPSAAALLGSPGRPKGRRRPAEPLERLVTPPWQPRRPGEGISPSPGSRHPQHYNTSSTFNLDVAAEGGWGWLS